MIFLFISRLKRVWILAFGLFTGCYKGHLYVQQEWVDREWLASSHIHTPDPRQAHPPQGQRLLIAWDFPKSLFDEQLHLNILVRFWDNTQVQQRVAVDRKRSFAALFFEQDEQCSNPKILTYRVQVINQRGQVVETWNHQFWTELINVGPGG